MITRLFPGRPLLSVLVEVTCGLLLYQIGLFVYRLLLHPLRRYPGPFRSKWSSWTGLSAAASGDRHLRALKDHEDYGPIVRMGPNVLSFNSIEALKEIYASRRANVKKDDWYKTIEAPTGSASTHSETDMTKHAMRRRILDHAFSPAAVQSTEPFILDNVKIWLECLGKGPLLGDGWTEPKDVNQWNSYLGYDIMGDLTFGKRFDCLRSEEHRYVPDLMLDGLSFIDKVGVHPWRSFLRLVLATPIPSWFGGEAARSNDKYIEYATEQVGLRMAGGSDRKDNRKDFMSYLLEARDPETGRGFGRGELNSDSGMLISAGSDTTAITLSSTMFYLLHNPNAMQKVVVEVRSAYASVEEIDARNVDSLVYLKACIDESLRMSPPVPAHLPREVLPGGLEVGEEYIPAGTIVCVAPYVIHHNPEYYPDPYVFKPERWIVGESKVSTEDQVATAKSAFCPFSLGSRGCVGKQVAYRELLISLSSLFMTYDIRLPATGKRLGEGDPTSSTWGRQRVDEYQLQDIFLVNREGPLVQFRPRE